MLTNVHIREFRSCHDVALNSLGNAVALVGRNGVGKSNILKAVHQTAAFATHPKSDRHDETRDVSLDVRLKDTSYRYIQRYRQRWTTKEGSPVPRLTIEESLSRVHDGDRLDWMFKRTDDHIHLRDGTEVKIANSASTMPVLMAFLPPDSPALSHIAPVFRFLSAVRYYPLDERDSYNEMGVMLEATFNEWRSGYAQTGEPSEAIVERLIHLKLEHPDRFDDFVQIVGPDGLDLVQDIVFHKVPLHPDISGATPPLFYWIGFEIPSPTRGTFVKFHELSLGTRRVIRALLAVFFDASTVMLLEHPEDGIHRGLLKKLVSTLLRTCAATQLIFASHSSVVLDLLKPEMLRLIDKRQGGTTSRAMTTTELTAAQQYLEQEGSLSDFLQLVEEH